MRWLIYRQRPTRRRLVEWLGWADSHVARLSAENARLRAAIRQHRNDLGPPKNPADADAALWAHG